jgi:hypothetical protein
MARTYAKVLRMCLYNQSTFVLHLNCFVFFGVNGSVGYFGI